MLIRALSIVLLTGVASGLTTARASAQMQDAHHVLTLHSGAVDYAPNALLDAGIRETLLARSGRPVDYFSEYLEFDRFPGTGRAVFADHLERKYAGRRIDLVLAMTNRSLEFALEFRERLFPGAALVFGAAGVDELEPLRAAGEPIAGVRVGNAYAETMNLTLRLHPTAREIYVVAVTPNTQMINAARSQLSPFASRVRIIYLEAETMPQLLDAVRAVPRNAAIIYLWFQKQGVEYLNNPDAPANLVAQAAKVPVYSVVDSIIGTGVVGGMVRDTRGTGVQVGRIAREVLDGTMAHTIPIEYAPIAPVFDWRQVRRWRINESLLPPDSELRFKEPTFWEEYRPYIVAAILVITAQLVLITALLTQRARRRRAEAGLRASFERIRYLAGRLINAQEKARADIARDLHDDVCQELVGVSMTLETLKRSAGSMGDPENQEEVTRLHLWTLDIIDGVRRLSHDLHPANLRLLGLRAALRAHCVEVEKRHDVQVSLTTDGDCRNLPPEVAVALFRIAQEALRNGAAHGEARRLMVSVVRTPGGVELIVTDDGGGFDVEAVAANGSGLGLVSIEERARIVGGTVRVISQRGQGTTIAVQVPLPVGGGTMELDGLDPTPAQRALAVAQLNRATEALNREVREARALVAASLRLSAIQDPDEERAQGDGVASSQNPVGTV